MKIEYKQKRRLLSYVAAVWVMFALFCLNVCIVYAEPVYGFSEKEAGFKMRVLGKSMEKDIPLNAETVTEIPRYITIGEEVYVLDEGGITVEVTGYGSAESADVVTTSDKLEHLPDNDLVRISKNIFHDGIDCELLYVIYRITDWNDDGIPSEYEALCEYGGLKKYSTSYDNDWVAHVRYDAYQILGGEKKQTLFYEYESGGTSYTGEKNRIKRMGTEQEKEEERDVIKPDKPRNKLLMKRVPHQEKTEELLDFLIPLAGITLFTILGGLLFALLYYLRNASAPLYALTAGGKYRYIGQAKLRESEGIYTAYLTKHHMEKAKLPSYKIRLTKKMLKKMKANMLKVQCPDGRVIMLIPGTEVIFSLEQS